MPFHFPDEQVVGYRDDDPIQEVNQKYLEAINLTYSYFPLEIFYMRTLLNYVKRPHSYSQTRTTNNIDYPKFKEACYAMGLLNDDKVYIDANHAIVESSTWYSRYYMRNLFATLLFSNQLAKLEIVWNNTGEFFY